MKPQLRSILLPLLAILCLTLSAPAFANIIFTTGPINGTLTGLFITGPNQPNLKGSVQDISDGFVATGSGPAFSLAFGAWVLTGDTPTTVSWSLSASAFGNETGSETVSLNSSTNMKLFTNTSFGYDIYKITIPFGASFTAGNLYWLTLNNADDSAHSGSMAWDYNAGPAVCNYRQNGANFGQCASGTTINAEHVTIPQGGGDGEAFTISGPTTPEPSSIVLFGSGIVGIAGLFRRKLNR